MPAVMAKRGPWRMLLQASANHTSGISQVTRGQRGSVVERRRAPLAALAEDEHLLLAEVQVRQQDAGTLGNAHAG